MNLPTIIAIIACCVLIVAATAFSKKTKKKGFDNDGTAFYYHSAVTKNGWTSFYNSNGVFIFRKRNGSFKL